MAEPQKPAPESALEKQTDPAMDHQKPAGDNKVPRIPDDPELLAGKYIELAEKLAEVIARLRAFDKARSPLPLFFFLLGFIAVVMGIVLRAYEGAVFHSTEFIGFIVLACVFFILSCATYIAELQTPRTALPKSGPERQTFDAAETALASAAEQVDLLTKGNAPSSLPQRTNGAEGGGTQGSVPASKET